MPQSIAQAQTAALNEGFFDNLGSKRLRDNKGRFLPRKSLDALIELAGNIIVKANENLHAAHQIATGALSESIKSTEPTVNNGILQVSITALDYYQYINKGVRGTVSGSGQYAFKNNFPSREMITSIQKWLNTGKASSRNVNAKKTPIKLEQKNTSISEISSAWAVAVSIKKHGIKGSGFFDRAIKSVQSEVSSKLGLALRVDIINALPKTL